ncbi:MAG TPA: peptidoglycan DD-metalloendopeptidase family protein, partial [Novosphingobium sp.]|nr:peptidoglycan DD-metalloendopeptidase family protein [Novosphingobium sp.]
DRLARLPGPVLRPAAGGASALPAQSAGPEVAAAPQRFALPVTGRLIAGFGGASQGGASQGLSIAARAGAEAAAPAAGKVGFAGPYPGYGQIVIIDHAGGWTSLVTGLAAVDVRAGDAVLAGAPLGVAGPGHPVVGYELHRAGGAVNPLDYLAAGLPG